MHYLVGSLVMFLMVLLMVLFYHLYSWDSGWSFWGGLRCWVSSFECGFVSERVSEKYFSYTYFILLVFFVVFDLEVSLLLKMPLQGVFYKNLSYYYFFIFLLSVGFGVEIDKGYMEWVY